MTTNQRRLNAEQVVWAALYFAAAGVASVLISNRVPSVGGSSALPTIVMVGLALLLFRAWHRFRNAIVRYPAWGVRIAYYRMNNAVLTPIMRMAHRRLGAVSVRGFDAYLGAESEADRQAHVQKVGEAIDLVERAWPARYARLRRLNPSLYVGRMRSGLGGGYYSNVNSIGLASWVVERASVEAIACLLCHELVHAFVESKGVRYTPLNESRYERLALIEMERWSKRLAEAGRLSEDVAYQLSALAAASRRRRWWYADGSWTFDLQPEV
jgi:hypothetical protein